MDEVVFVVFETKSSGRRHGDRWCSEDVTEQWNYLRLQKLIFLVVDCAAKERRSLLLYLGVVRVGINVSCGIFAIICLSF